MKIHILFLSLIAGLLRFVTSTSFLVVLKIFLQFFHMESSKLQLRGKNKTDLFRSKGKYLMPSGIISS